MLPRRPSAFLQRRMRGACRRHAQGGKEGGLHQVSLHVAQHATVIWVIGPTDIYVLAGVLADDRGALTLRELAGELHVDHTLVHRALKRTEAAGLYSASSKQVNRANFEELTIHAGRFIAPARLGELTRGIPAAWAAEPISTVIRQSAQEPPPVWPDAMGAVRGQALEPLHPAAVEASQETPALASFLSIIDSLRAGDVRVRKVAATALRETLKQTPHKTAV